MRILIADDDFTSRTVLTGLLKQSGHEAVVTVNGMEAWMAMQRPDAPRLAILDWMMLEMDGLQLVRRVCTLQTDRPYYIVMLTVKSEKADIIAGLESGANDYLAKSFDPSELRTRVEVGWRMVEMQAPLADKVKEPRQALDQSKTMCGIVSICINCKKIREESGYWNQVGINVSNHTEAEFRHGICSEYIKKLYPEFQQYDRRARSKTHEQ
jgi:phosphoserine phosphatase RsbU/P